MTTKHTIQKRFDFPMKATDLHDFASEVLAVNPEAEMSVMQHTGGSQRDPYPVAITLTAAWES